MSQVYAVMYFEGSPPRSVFSAVRADSPDMAMAYVASSLGEGGAARIIACLTAEEVESLSQHLKATSSQL